MTSLQSHYLVLLKKNFKKNRNLFAVKLIWFWPKLSVNINSLLFSTTLQNPAYLYLQILKVQTNFDETGNTTCSESCSSLWTFRWGVLGFIFIKAVYIYPTVGYDPTGFAHASVQSGWNSWAGSNDIRKKAELDGSEAPPSLPCGFRWHFSDRVFGFRSDHHVPSCLEYFTRPWARRAKGGGGCSA